MPRLSLLRQATGSLVVKRTKGASERAEKVLPGGEIALVAYAGADPIARADDASDGEEDGVTLIEAVPVGYYLLRDAPPEGFASAPPVIITVRPSGNELRIRNVMPDQVGTLTIERFSDDDPLPGGRVDVETPLGIYSVTDGADGEVDGRTILTGLISGSYLVHDVPPPDYAAVREPLRVRVRSGRNQIRLDTPLLATVTVARTDQSGAPLPGGELSLRNAAEAIVARADDGTDGRIDGVTTLPGLPAGDYEVIDSGPPAGYGPADDLPITIAPGENRVALMNPRDEGVLVIAATLADGTPLRGVCYEVRMDGRRVRATCDVFDGSSDGTATVEGLESGTYTVLETWVPVDYITAPGQIVTIHPDRTTTLSVVTTLRPE